ncbi:MAG: competence/damage-inducible protein A [Elusimicrobia bacterium]|nr:competence/damage-inducible protein A [Candidatus Liberimonas magnetica]
MKTELISIGSELLSGKINTNVSYLGEKLGSIGLGLAYETSVGDKIEDISAVFENAIKRSQIIIATGGLGPTFDDLTREAVSRVLDRPLTLKRELLSSIARYFLERKIEMPKNNERQAYIIEGAEVIPNLLGTAPGQILAFEKNKSKKIIILLPGPPKEIQPMFEKTVFPFLKKYETGFRKKFTLHLCGLAESEVDEKIAPIIEAETKLEAGRDSGVEFSILAHQMIIDIGVVVSGKNEMLVEETLTNLKNEFYDILGINIFGEDKKNLESVVGELLSKNKKSLALAESCTGGVVSHRITNIAGSSLYFKEGVVAYSNDSKVKILGVNKETIEKYGAVSAQVAVEMAEGIRSISLADYTLSVTGLAGPGGGTQEKPVGLVYIGLCGPTIKEAYKYQFSGNRVEVRQRTANQALDLLRRQLLSDSGLKVKTGL